MVTEELIRDVAKEISRRLLAGKTETPQIAQKADCACKHEKVESVNPKPVLETPPAANVQPATTQSTNPVHLAILSLQPSQHPSQQRIKAGDALNDFIEFLQQNKQCTMEKNKPCDNCDICNTLGF